MAFAIVIPVLLSMYYSYASDYQPQGRYVLSCLLPLMFFVTAGIKTVLDKLCKNKKTTTVLVAVLATAIIAITLYCCFGVFLPAYQ